MLHLRRRHWLEMVGHAYDGLPDEACGLLGGHDDRAELFLPCRNADASSRTFSLGPDCWGAADERITGAGLDIVGVVHSHTHTEAYPSPTDIEESANPFLPTSRWVLVSLKPPAPVVRSYRIVDGVVAEEPIDVVGR